MKELGHVWSRGQGPCHQFSRGDLPRLGCGGGVQCEGGGVRVMLKFEETRRRVCLRISEGVYTDAKGQ